MNTWTTTARRFSGVAKFLERYFSNGLYIESNYVTRHIFILSFSACLFILKPSGFGFKRIINLLRQLDNAYKQKEKKRKTKSFATFISSSGITTSAHSNPNRTSEVLQSLNFEFSKRNSIFRQLRKLF